MMQLKFNVERKFDIPPSKFTPAPKVHSTVLRLEKRDTEIQRGFDDFLKTVFSQRRKKLKNVIDTEIQGDKRPEELSRDELLEVFQHTNAQRQS